MLVQLRGKEFSRITSRLSKFPHVLTDAHCGCGVFDVCGVCGVCDVCDVCDVCTQGGLDVHTVQHPHTEEALDIQEGQCGSITGTLCGSIVQFSVASQLASA